MRRGFLTAAWLVFGLACTGCTPTAAPPPAPTPSQPAMSPQDELARTCRVCVVDKGERIEEYLPARLDLERDGRTYRFCSDGCRGKFDAEPSKYLLPAE